MPEAERRPDPEQRPDPEPADPPDATAEEIAPSDEPGPTEPEIGDQTAVPAPDYSEAGVPSLDYVRDRIEGRYATSVGAAELASETPQAQSLEEQLEERERAGHDRLAEIRRSLGEDSEDSEDSEDRTS